MNEQLTRRIKRLEEHPGIRTDIREHKLIVVGVGESEHEALLREGLNPKDPGVDLILIQVVASPERE